MSSLSIDSVIERPALGRYRWGLYALCGFFLALEGYDAYLVSNLAPVIAKSVGIPFPALGKIFSTQAIGFAVAYYTVPMLADYIGRRWVVVLCGFFFGLFTFLTTQVHDLDSFLVVRLLTFFALGGAIPNAIALITELLPKTRQGPLLTWLYISHGLGASMAGWIGSYIAQIASWQMAFWAGSAVMAVVVPLLFIFLPESPRYRLNRNPRDARIGKTLARVQPGLQVAEGTEFISSEAKETGITVGNLFRGGRAPQTVLLWAAVACVFCSAATLTVWMPTLFNKLGGVDPLLAPKMVALSAIGGLCGPFLVTWLLRRIGMPLALATMAAGAWIVMSAAGVIADAPQLGWLFGAVYGLLAIGAQAGLNGLIPTVYPTSMRSTGIGWATGCGRISAIFGPTLVGVMLANHWGASSIYMVIAAPFFAGALMLTLLHLVRSEKRVAQPAT